MKPFEDILMDDILPQQPPFRFVEKLLFCDAKDATVTLTVGNGHMLMDGDELSAAGLMEHMAQACAARNGYYAKYILHVDVSVGFIGHVLMREVMTLFISALLRLYTNQTLNTAMATSVTSRDMYTTMPMRFWK